MNLIQCLARSRSVRRLLAASFMFLAVLTPNYALAAASGTTNSTPEAKQQLNFNNAFEETQDAGGITVMKAIFFIAFLACLLIGLVLAAAGILSFMRTHQMDKLQNNALGIGALFALSGIFFWLMAMEGRDSNGGVIRPASNTPVTEIVRSVA